MKRFIVIVRVLVATVLLAIASQARTPTPISTSPGNWNTASQRACPIVSVYAPETINEGTSFFFTANVAGGDASVTLTYHWTISAGLIQKGQGTSTIEVPTAGLGTKTITATVEVGGFLRSCPTSSSASAYIAERPKPRKFGQFGSLAKYESNAKLDDFATELRFDPGSQGYIIGYGGRTSPVGTGQTIAEAVKTYLVDKHYVGNSLVTVDGGYKEEVTTELWLVPPGAIPPTATPTVDPSKLKTSKPARKTPASRMKKPD